MADSTVADLSKLKVVDLRKELKSRGLPSNGDKSELVTRLQSAMAQEEHGDINLDSDEIDSDGVLEDDDDKSQTDILDDTAVESLNEELALSEQASKPTNIKPLRTLKRKVTESSDKTEKTGENTTAKKIVLNRAASLTTPAKPAEEDENQSKPAEVATESNKVKITADVDPKTRLELRAKRFGLPVKMDDNVKKEARMRRFGQSNTTVGANEAPTSTPSETLDKLKKRAERFGQSVSKVMTDIENKEKLERRKAKFGTA